MSESVAHQLAKARLGKTLRGKWELEELLGVGGMAAVYKARHRNGTRVAIKILHATIAECEEVRRRFMHEGHCASRIRHPAIVRVIDDDVDEAGNPFLVMDYVEGITLADKVQDHLFREEELLDVAEQVASALAAAHDAGVVHRDLKPDNLIVEANGRIRMLDFGIARLVDPDEEKSFATRTGIAFGTPGFIAPEQALGHRDRVGPRTDVFALGATLFYLATGEFLHMAETPQELLVLVATRPPRSLLECAPHIAPEVAAFVDRATRFEPELRWPSGEAMAEAARTVRQRLLEEATASTREVHEAPRTPAPLTRDLLVPNGPVLPPIPIGESVTADHRDESLRAHVLVPEAAPTRPSANPLRASALPTRPSISRVRRKRARSFAAGATALAALAIAFAVAATSKSRAQTQAAAGADRTPQPVAVATTPAPSSAEPEPSFEEVAAPVTSAGVVESTPPLSPKKATPKQTPKPRNAARPSTDPLKALESVVDAAKHAKAKNNKPDPKLGY